MNDLLSCNGHANLILTQKDLTSLRELVTILEPFADATDMVQSDCTVTISCVTPIVLSLNRHLQHCLTAITTLRAFLNELLRSLRDRFATLFTQLGVNFSSNKSCTNLSFDSTLFLMSPALDPEYAFNWLEDHPGTEDEKETLRFKINGMTLIC
jgi:hypothetical protein